MTSDVSNSGFKPPLADDQDHEHLSRVVRSQREEILALHRERELLTRNLLKTQHIECAGRMATGISHDLSNLATSMLGHAERLADQPDSSAAAESLSAIRHAAERTAELTRQLQTLTDSSHGDQGVSDLNDAVESLARTLRRVVPARIELVVDLADEPLTVNAQPSELVLMLTQLVLNARDAISGNGIITLSTRSGPAETSSAARKNQDRPRSILEVADTGIGMDVETVQRAFEPFFTTKPTNTGLGLTALRHLSDRLKGSITVDSAPGWGTSLSISLPGARPSSQRAVQKTRTTDSAAGSEMILVVDDDAGVAAIASKMLQARGYAARHVTDPAQVFEILRGGEPVDLMITDAVMPGWSGQALAERGQHIRPSMKVLYSSGYRETDLRRSWSIPDDELFLPKPYTRDQLIGMVRAVLDEPLYKRQPGGQVLIVNNNDSARDAFADTLISAGLEVLRACNGDEALRLIGAERPSVVVCDVMLPGKDGIATCEQAMQQYPDTKIVMVAEPDEAPLCIAMASQLGAARTLTRPVSDSQLRECVTELLAAG